jgi:hypothetical protein
MHRLPLCFLIILINPRFLTYSDIWSTSSCSVICSMMSDQMFSSCLFVPEWGF